MKYRIKFLIVFIAFILFWFLIFYPHILPYLNEIKIYPTLGVIIFETLLFFTLYILSLALLGKNYSKYSLKIAFALFVIYHVLDSVEPPFILSSNYADINNPTAIISWDYGLAYPLHTFFNIPYSTLYYLVNFGFLSILLIIMFLIFKPQILGKIVKKALR